jgi:hypothetical protein
MSNKIKFGILSNSLTFEAWEVATIEHLLNHPLIELKLLVINNTAPLPQVSFVNKVLHYPYYNFLYRAYKRFRLKANSYRLIPMGERFIAVPKLYCTPLLKGKYSTYFNDSDVAQIKSHELDFMLRFGFNIIKGDILQSCKYGIWSFHHADNDFIRGGPIGFWEIYLKRNLTAAVLQQLNTALDQGKILRKGYLKTIDHSFSENIDQLTEMAAIWPLQVCIDLLNRQDIFKNEVSFSKQVNLYKYPKNGQFINFIMKLFFNKIKFHYNQMFNAESWQIAFFKGNTQHVINDTLPKPTYISSSLSEFYKADPFLWPNEHEKLILFEYFSYKENVGKIAMSDFDGKNFKLLDFGFNTHLSYPFCFSYEKEVYCIPEQAAAKNVSLYKLNSNGQVSFVNHLIENFEGRDTSIFFYENQWWLFCTKANYFENAALFIFCAPTLFETFKPHQNNPVKVDIRNARPAGNLFIKDNVLHRPAQNSAMHYGHMVNINKIKKLNIASFEEEIISCIEPEKFGNYIGIHHIVCQHECVVVDLKQKRFSLNLFKNQIKRKFKKLFHLN